MKSSIFWILIALSVILVAFIIFKYIINRKRYSGGGYKLIPQEDPGGGRTYANAESLPVKYMDTGSRGEQYLVWENKVGDVDPSRVFYPASGKITTVPGEYHVDTGSSSEDEFQDAME